MQLMAALVPGSSPKSKAENRQFAREKAGSKGKERHRVIACKLNSAYKRQPHCWALNGAVSHAWCSCQHLPPIRHTGEGMGTGEHLKFALQS